MNQLEGTLLENRYQIERLLAQGGMGAIYRGYDTKLQTLVAIKENSFRTPQAVEQFEQEGLILARLRHPGLPRVIDHFSHEGHQYMVMDFVDGQDLWEIIKNQGTPIDELIALRYLIQVSDAVDYLHHFDPPILHRDIKPQNIKITPQGQAVLVDFGIAKLVYEEDERTRTGARGITPGFSPPEQYSGEGTDTTSDIYALGATLYAVLTGEKPPDSIRLITGRATLTPPNLLNKKVSPQLSHAITHAMQVSQDERPPNVSIWREELETIHGALARLNGEGVVAEEALIEEEADDEGSTALLDEHDGRTNFIAEPANTNALTGKIDLPDAPKTTKVDLPNSRPITAPAPSHSPWLIGLGIGFLMLVASLTAFWAGGGFNRPQEINTETILLALMATGTAQAEIGQSEPSVNFEATLEALTIIVTQQAGQNSELNTPEPTATTASTATPTSTSTPTPTLTPTSTPTSLATPTPTITPTLSVGVQPSATGYRLAFQSNRFGSPQIFETTLDGSEVRQISYAPFIAEQPTWSPDGTKLAVKGWHDGQDGIYIINRDGSNITLLTNQMAAHPAWSVTNLVAFDIGNRLDGARADGSGGLILAQTAGDNHASWSPGGTQIIYDTEHSANNYELFMVQADGQNVTQLTFTQNSNEKQPAWSPNGEQIVFVHDADGPDDLYLMTVNGGNLTRLTFTPSGQQWYNREPAWSPDGQQIAFTSGRDGNAEIYVINVDGSNLTRVTNHPAEDVYPAWSPQ